MTWVQTLIVYNLNGAHFAKDYSVNTEQYFKLK